MTTEISTTGLGMFISATYEVGRDYRDRPVAVVRDGNQTFWIDTLDGRLLWIHDLLVTRAWGADAGRPIEELDRLARALVSDLATHAKEGGHRITHVNSDLKDLLDIADAKHYARDDFMRTAVGQAMAADAREWAEQQRINQVLDRAAADFSWADLASLWDEEPPTPEYLARTDGPCAFYLGTRNLMVGFTESGKSWLVALAIKQEIKAGRMACYLDFENGALLTTSRLRALGLTPEQVKKHVRYVHLDTPLPPGLATQQAEKLWADGARLMFADALTPIAHALDLDTSGGDTSAVEQVYTVVLDPWVQVGFAGVLLDNTGKGNKYGSLGSQHKDAAVGGTVLAVVTEKKFSMHTAGSSKLYLNKDRGGAAETVLEEDRRWWGTLQIAPDPVKDETGRTAVTCYIEPPPEEPEDMEKFYEEIDRKAATLALARQTLVNQGVTFTDSMKTLADWMDLVKPTDARFAHAHVDRSYVTDVLFEGTTPAQHELAGLHCTRTSYKDKSGRRSNRYRVEVAPMPPPTLETGE